MEGFDDTALHDLGARGNRSYNEFGNFFALDPIQQKIVKQLGAFHFFCSNAGFRGIVPGNWTIKIHCYFTGRYEHQFKDTEFPNLVEIVPPQNHQQIQEGEIAFVHG